VASREEGRNAGEDQRHGVQRGRDHLLAYSQPPARLGSLGAQKLRRSAGARSGVPRPHRLRLRLLCDQLEEGRGVQVADHARSARSSASTSALPTKPSPGRSRGSWTLPEAMRAAAPEPFEGALRTATNRPRAVIPRVSPRATRCRAAAACYGSSRTPMGSMRCNSSISFRRPTVALDREGGARAGPPPDPWRGGRFPPNSGDRRLPRGAPHRPTPPPKSWGPATRPGRAADRGLPARDWANAQPRAGAGCGGWESLYHPRS